MIEALAVVPPISRVMTFFMPARRALNPAANTPAAGPDSSTNTGRSAAVEAGVKPPADCMIRSGASISIDSRPARIALRYWPISGRTYALTVVVAVRSYSPRSGSTSEERETGIRGRRCRKNSPHNHFASPRGEKCALVAAIRGVVYGGKRATGKPWFGVTFRDIA